MIISKTFEKISFFILIVLLLPLFSGCIGSEEDVGENFVFTGLSGETKHLSDYRGKVVILDMWATWCGPCQLMMVELEKVYENYSRNDLEIISVDIDGRENAQKIQEFRDWFVQNYNIELNWIFGMDDGSISEKYMNEGLIPTLAIFDQKGRLHFREAGLCGFKEIPYGLPSNTTLLAPILDELID